MNAITRSTPLGRMESLLSGAFASGESRIFLPELDQEILNLTFRSRAHEILPREDEHIRRQPAFLALLRDYLTRNTASNEHLFHNLQTPDRDIRENNEFSYPVLKPSRPEKTEGMILLLHGLNERSWDKYLPWASRLAESTGKAVVLFPLAFHMNRAPETWSLLRPMMGVSRERKALLPDLEGSSFANAAISYRMQFAPQRFILSGLQTFMDLLQLMRRIRKGEHPGIAPGAVPDIFAYSIGATLAEVLLMTNPHGYFSHSRAFLFCGGPALDLATPVNRGIIDNHGFSVLVGFFHDLVDGRSPEMGKLEEILEDNSLLYFKSLLIHGKMEKIRDNRLNEIRDRLYSLTLEQDRVMTPLAVRKTLDREEAGITGICETLDYPGTYTHENPFGQGASPKPAKTSAGTGTSGTAPSREDELREEAFDQVFRRAADFLA